jgi:hypothetical protein
MTRWEVSRDFPQSRFKRALNCWTHMRGSSLDFVCARKLGEASVKVETTDTTNPSIAEQESLTRTNRSTEGFQAALTSERKQAIVVRKLSAF